MVNDRPRAMFIAGSRGLDFLNSIATPVDKPIEFIGSGEHFLQWLRDARTRSGRGSGRAARPRRSR